MCRPVLLISRSHGTVGIDRMEDDGSAPPLPRRAPGDSGWEMPEPVRPVSLPEPVVQRILAALNAVQKQPSPLDEAAPAEAPAPDRAAPAEPLDSTGPRAPDPAAPAAPPGSAGPRAADPWIPAEAPAPGRASSSEPAVQPHAASSGRPPPLPQRVPCA